MLLLGDPTFSLEEMTVKWPFMKPVETVSKDSTTPKMKRLRSLLVLHSTLQERPPLLEISTGSTSTISTRRDLNGMKSVANKLKTTIL